VRVDHIRHGLLNIQKPEAKSQNSEEENLRLFATFQRAIILASQRPYIPYNEDTFVKTGIQVIREAFKRFVIPMEMGIQTKLFAQGLIWIPDFSRMTTAILQLSAISAKFKQLPGTLSSGFCLLVPDF
jgi:hypothetical protein